MADNNYRRNDVFWIYDPMILFSNGNWYKIIPTSNMTQVEALNAMTRLFLYLLILSALLSLIINYAYALIIAIVVIIIIYFITANTNYNIGDYRESFNESYSKNNTESNLKTEKVLNNRQIPTNNNPFMNINQIDWDENTNQLPICNLEKDDIQEYLRDKVQISLNEKNDRHFYTTSVTTIPNEQNNFAKWLYDLPETCKENQLNCLRYEDVRYSRYNPDLENNVT
ncbi:hypothetical protein QKC54_gp0389 [Megavirus baoshan]|uniref:Minor capsid protein P9 transmembrane helices domain-containing protein n=1 Tax=Megavirus baoshan TaxID=2496520 RepID=A0A3S8UX86_9VIRU|nr:hypothetical protein QKC54_gp0389 [Megavirus baoshan]AZL89436.1 hypothetical protein Mb0683 [Megavirus baoshan]